MSRSDWESSKGIAKAILRDRTQRRMWMQRWILATVGWMVVGLWVIDGWLGESSLRFIIWWGICGVMAVILMVSSLYDSVSVMSEEREKTKK